MALLSAFLGVPTSYHALDFCQLRKMAPALAMFGLCLNVLILLQFSLVFIPLCPNFVELFLPEFLFNQLQTLAQ